MYRRITINFKRNKDQSLVLIIKDLKSTPPTQKYPPLKRRKASPNRPVLELYPTEENCFIMYFLGEPIGNIVIQIGPKLRLDKENKHVQSYPVEFDVGLDRNLNLLNLSLDKTILAIGYAIGFHKIQKNYISSDKPVERYKIVDNEEEIAQFTDTELGRFGNMLFAITIQDFPDKDSISLIASNLRFVDDQSATSDKCTETSVI